MQFRKIIIFFSLSSLVTINASFLDLTNTSILGQKVKNFNIAKTTKNAKSVVFGALNGNLSDIAKILSLNGKNLNILNIPGLGNFGMKCDIGGKIKMPSIDICSKIPKGVNKHFTLNLGVCKATTNLSTKCLTDLAQSKCQEIENSVNQTIMLPINILRSSITNLAITGDNFITEAQSSNGGVSCDGLFAEKRNDIIKNSNGQSINQIRMTYYRPTMVTKYAFKSTGADSIYDTRLEDWKQCIFLNANGDTTSTLKKCSNIKNQIMPKTEKEVKDNIIDAANFLLTGVEDPLIDNYSMIYTIQSNYIKQCSNKNNPVECENQLWTDGFETNSGDKIKMPDVYKHKLDKIEKTEARFMTIVNEATRKERGIVFYSESFIRTLPIKEQEKYRFLAKKSINKKILNAYFIKEMSDNEKEIVSIEYNMQKVASSSFYPEQEMKKINALVESFSKDNPSNNSGNSLDAGSKLIGGIKKAL
jgi:hypothetical protein